jgi:hypothetical protein
MNHGLSAGVADPPFAARAPRVDTFNGNCGLMRGLAAPFVVIFVVAIVASKGWISLSSNLRYFFESLSNLWLKDLVPVATLSQQPHRLKRLPPRVRSGLSGDPAFCLRTL